MGTEYQFEHLDNTSEEKVEKKKEQKKAPKSGFFSSARSPVSNEPVDEMAEMTLFIKKYEEFDFEKSSSGKVLIRKNMYHNSNTYLGVDSHGDYIIVRKEHASRFGMMRAAVEAIDKFLTGPRVLDKTVAFKEYKDELRRSPPDRDWETTPR